MSIIVSDTHTFLFRIGFGVLSVFDLFGYLLDLLTEVLQFGHCAFFARVEIPQGLRCDRNGHSAGFRMNTERRFEQMVHSLRHVRVQTRITVFKHDFVDQGRVRRLAILMGTEEMHGERRLPRSYLVARSDRVDHRVGVLLEGCPTLS